MSSKFRDGPWWFLPTVAFFLGLFIGWLVIGWGVWPVTYTNALPQDLRASEQQEYLLMTAESFASSGDLAVAQQRLAAWPNATLQEDLTMLIQRLEAVNPLQASQVMLLESALFPGTTTPAVIPESSSETTNLLQTVCKTALWVLLILGGILGILYLWRRWRLANQPQQLDMETFPSASTARDAGSEMYEDAGAHLYTTPSSHRAGPVITQEEIVYERDEDESEDESADDDLGPAEFVIDEEEAESEPEKDRPVASRQVSQSDLEPDQVEKVAAAAAATTATGGMSKVGEWKAYYEMGAADYDEAFDIYDANGAYIGQCGLELVDPVGKMHDQAAALQVWLWDTNDPDTKVKVLISEGAYRDTAMRDQLAGGHDMLPVRQGTEFELRSYNLLLKGVVDKVEYAEQPPVGGIFSELQARLAVYLK